MNFALQIQLGNFITFENSVLLKSTTITYMACKAKLGGHWEELEWMLNSLQ